MAIIGVPMYYPHVDGGIRDEGLSLRGLKSMAIKQSFFGEMYEIPPSSNSIKRQNQQNGPI
jgi:hypothetical protein